MAVSDFIKSIPVIRVLIPLLAGVIVGGLISFSDAYTGILAGTNLLLIFILIWFRSSMRRPPYAYFGGLLLQVLFIFTGTLLVLLQTRETDLPGEQPEAWWVCRIEGFPVERTNSCRTKLLAVHYFGHELVSPPPFHMFLYLNKNAMETLPGPGNYILVKMKPVRPKQNGNPKEFNYRSYLFRKGVYYQAFANEDSWNPLEKKDKRFRYLPLIIQYRFTSRLKQVVTNPESFGIMSALAVGNRDYIDEEIKAAYSDAGAMHVLAVSGLHVGLVWYVLNIFFGRLKYFRYTRVIYWFLMTGLLWMYVMIAGMTPSVTRAGIMLTLVITSSLMRRNSSSSNPVFLSAFVLILVNPDIIFDVGFQFSYLAVFGILFFQPGLKSLFKIKGKLLNYFIELVTVSIAAQLGTFIPAIYYFNKFPSYFIITNLIVIPVVTIVLFCIIISVFFWSVEPLFNFVSQCGAFFTNCMNYGVKIIEALPGSSIKMIYVDSLEVVLLVLAMILISLFMLKKIKILLTLFFLTISIMLIYGGIRDWQMKRKGFVVIHNIQDILAVNLYSNGKHFMISSDLDTAREAQIVRNCGNFWLHGRVGVPVFIDLNREHTRDGIHILKIKNSENYVIWFDGISMFIMNDSSTAGKYISNFQIYCDFIIINTRGDITLPSFINLSEEAKLIISSGFRGRVNLSKCSFPDADSLILYDVQEYGACQTLF